MNTTLQNLMKTAKEKSVSPRVLSGLEKIARARKVLSTINKNISCLEHESKVQKITEEAVKAAIRFETLENAIIAEEMKAENTLS